MEKTHIKEGFSSETLMNLFTKLHGKELSYNNLLDVDAAVNLMNLSLKMTHQLLLF